MYWRVYAHVHQSHKYLQKHCSDNFWCKLQNKLDGYHSRQMVFHNGWSPCVVEVLIRGRGLPEMDRSGVKKFPSSWGGALFCHKNQSCSKLPEMDRSGVRKFSLIIGGRGFSATNTKVAWNCLKWIDLVSKNFPSWGGSATKTKVAQNCLKWIDPV